MVRNSLPTLGNLVRLKLFSSLFCTGMERILLSCGIELCSCLGQFLLWPKAAASTRMLLATLCLGHSWGSLDPHPRSEASRAGTPTSSRSTCEWPPYHVGIAGAASLIFSASALRSQDSCLVAVLSWLLTLLRNFCDLEKKSCISFVACTINWKCCFQNYSQRKNAKKLVSAQILQIRIRENLKFICSGKAGVFWWVLKMAIRQSNPDLD